ncbi:MAG: hypothetical protein RLZZ126_636 [Pseudomonadota bacterium]|jgi:D-erythronate 2-dehydrogenase
MQVVITGGAGFVGVLLARALLAKGGLSLAGAPTQPITELVLVDRAEPPADLRADSRVKSLTGDLYAQLTGRSAHVSHDPGRGPLPPTIIGPHTAAVFHLAAAVSGECEADFDLGMRSNYLTTHALLEACRAAGHRPLVFFASSIAVFGHTAVLPMPDLLSDTTLPNPQTSYGAQKAVGELLMADYGRKGFIRPRTARLATVSVRAGRPNGAASGFFSGMIREPLAGIASNVPVAPETCHPLSSPGCTVRGIIRCVEASDADWGSLTAINLPGLSISVGAMAQALRNIAGEDAWNLLTWNRDPKIESIVAAWPRALASPRAHALGLHPNGSFEEIVQEYVRENPDAVRIALRPQ